MANGHSDGMMDFGNRVPLWLQIVGAVLTAALAIIVLLTLIVNPVSARVELNSIEINRQRAELRQVQSDLNEFRELQIRIEERTKRIELKIDKMLGD